MALQKSIILDSGVTVTYHRVVSVNNITNSASIIEVASYTSAAKRQEEVTKLANHEPMNIFIETEYISLAYDATLDVTAAYTYLLTLDKYSGATTVD
jgi:hypothetical protein